MAQIDEKFIQSRKDKGEVVGGGFMIFRRGKKTGRIGIKRNSIAFEHGDLVSVQAEVNRLEEVHPGEKFVIFMQIST